MEDVVADESRSTDSQRWHDVILTAARTWSRRNVGNGCRKRSEVQNLSETALPTATALPDGCLCRTTEKTRLPERPGTGGADLVSEAVEWVGGKY